MIKELRRSIQRVETNTMTVPSVGVRTETTTCDTLTSYQKTVWTIYKGWKSMGFQFGLPKPYPPTSVCTCECSKSESDHLRIHGMVTTWIPAVHIPLLEALVELWGQRESKVHFTVCAHLFGNENEAFAVYIQCASLKTDTKKVESGGEKEEEKEEGDEDDDDDDNDYEMTVQVVAASWSTFVHMPDIVKSMSEMVDVEAGPLRFPKQSHLRRPVPVWSYLQRDSKSRADDVSTIGAVLSVRNWKEWTTEETTRTRAQVACAVKTLEERRGNGLLIYRDVHSPSVERLHSWVERQS